MTKPPSPHRIDVLRAVAEAIPSPDGDSCVRVAVDGSDGAGKTVFADELATIVRLQHRVAIRVSADNFHNVRAIRYRRGRDSPAGFWLDSYNYDRLRSDMLEPLGPGGSRRYRPAAHDLRTDAELSPAALTAPPGAVLILDGLFLHRDELVACWDLSAFLDVPVSVAVQRLAARDGSDPDPDHPSLRRYVQAQRSYAAACSPGERATILIDNARFDTPQIVRRRPASRL